MGQGLIDPWGVVLAAVPILCIVVAILCRVRALHAVLIAIGITLLLSFRFPFGWSEVHDRAGSLGSVIVTVVFILLGGILLSEQLAVSGAQDRISGWLSAAVRTPERALLLIGIGVAPLAESVIGFGVGVIVSIPLLMRLGIGATRSTSVSLLGIFLAPWGSLGPGLMIAAGLSGIDIHELGAWTAIANVPVVAVMVAAIAIVGLGWRGAVRSAGEWGAAAGLMVVTVYACSRWVTPALGGVAASLVGIAVLIVCAAVRGHRPPAMDSATRRAFGPYALLILAMLAVTGLTQIVDLGSWRALVTNPGLWLVVTAALSPSILRLARADTSVAARRGLRLWVPVCGLNILYIVFGALLSINGMTGELAAAAALLGGGFIVLTPAIGYVAGYATASNSGSSAMLASGITSTAHTLGADAAAILGLQNAATGAAIMASPSRVAIAERIANQQADDGDRVDARTVLRHVLISGASAVLLLTIASSAVVLA